MKTPRGRSRSGFRPRRLASTTQASGLADLSVRDRLLKGSVWVLAAKIGGTLAKLLSSVLIVRLLPPSDAGIYFLAFTLVNLGGTVAQLGLNKTVVRLVAESLATGHPGRARASIRVVLRYAALGCIIVAGTLVLGGGRALAHLLSGSRSEVLANAMMLIAAWSVTVALYDLLADVFRGFHDIPLASFFEGFAFTGLSMLSFSALWLLRGRATLEEILGLSAAAGAVTVLVAGLVLRPRVLGLGPPEPVSRKHVFSIAWPLLVTNIIIYALSSASDLWVLGAFRPAEDVAAYGAAIRLVSLVHAPSLLLAAVVPPLIAGLNAQGKKNELQRTLRAAAALAMVPSFLALTVYLVLGRSILTMLFGPFYRQAWPVLIVLSVGQVFGTWAGACGLTLQMTGRQKAMMAITLLCGAGSVSSALLLVGSHGAIGVASATASFLILQNVLMLLVVRRTVGVWTFALLSPRALGALVRRRSE